MQQVQTIIFDLGGVLIDWSPVSLYTQIFSNKDEAEWFIDNICDLEWNEEQDGGRTIAEATQIQIEKFPHWEDEIRMYYDRWEEMLLGPIEGTVDILRSLHSTGTLPLYALTNWSAETFPTALRRFDFLQVFKGILVSGEENLKKPDPAIYKMILDRYDIDPKTTLFIDDNGRNVKAAIETGIPSIHFTSPEQLRAELKQRGVL